MLCCRRRERHGDRVQGGGRVIPEPSLDAGMVLAEPLLDGTCVEPHHRFFCRRTGTDPECHLRVNANCKLLLSVIDWGAIGRLWLCIFK